MKVADFFAGGGGFSEGFRQMGFDVVFALDNWEPAVQTHDLNHPDCKAVKMNILELDTPEKIDEVVPDAEILIGSPPCVAFSGSNKAGKADKSLGLRLIEAYLRIVAWKQKKGVLRYWILENVPNSAKFIKDEYTFKELGLPGEDVLTIKERGIYNAADFGAPQTRTRFFCGDYPEPKKTHKESEWVAVASVLEALTPSDGKVKDPNYPGLCIDTSGLIDHDYDTTVEEWEWKSAKRSKRDHGYMGKMSFPEDASRPSRTVMATQSASTREAMLLPGPEEGTYRMPTIREIGCFMSFPITYQFEAGSEGSKYRLVGNAVCCKMSAALARAIAEKEGLEYPMDDAIDFSHRPTPSLDLKGRPKTKKERKPKRAGAKYARHVPYIKIKSMRAELTNKDSDFDNGDIQWTCYMHRGGGKSAKKTKVPADLMKDLLIEFGGFEEFDKRLDEFFIGRVPDAQTFQEIYRRLYENEMMGPDEALEGIKEIIDEQYPEDLSEDAILKPIMVFGLGEVTVPIRVAAAAYACDKLVRTLR